jgi:hypothetical protein
VIPTCGAAGGWAVASTTTGDGFDPPVSGVQEVRRSRNNILVSGIFNFIVYIEIIETFRPERSEA